MVPCVFYLLLHLNTFNLFLLSQKCDKDWQGGQNSKHVFLLFFFFSSPKPSLSLSATFLDYANQEGKLQRNTLSQLSGDNNTAIRFKFYCTCRHIFLNCSLLKILAEERSLFSSSGSSAPKMISLTPFRLLSKYPNQALGRVITSPAFIHILFAIISLDRFLLLVQPLPNMNSIMKNLFLFCFNLRKKGGNSSKYPFTFRHTIVIPTA